MSIGLEGPPGRRSGIAGAVALAVVAILSGAPAFAGSVSDQDLALLRSAFRSVREEKFDAAVALAAKAEERIGAKVVRWLDLARPKSGHLHTEIAAFIEANPTWPNRKGLWRQAETTLPPEMPAVGVVAWFEQHPPVSALGLGRYADALAASGEADRAADLVRRFWVDLEFADDDDENDFRRRFAAILGPADHAARLERVLWDHKSSAARRLLPLVDAGHRAVAEARLALAGDEPGIAAVLNRVPDQLQNDPGLAYERLRWRREKRNYRGVLEILAHPPVALGRPALWWTERNFMARHLLEGHDPAAAYSLAAAHGQTEGQAYAEAEFLAGWLALRHLRRPADALGHFRRLYGAVTAPMSRARGAYWCGRAADALGDHAQAREWYGKAALFPTMFYGQLAAAALAPTRPPAIPAEPTVSREDAVHFARRGMVQAVRLLHEVDSADKADLIGVFLRALARDVAGPAEWAQLAQLALEVRRPDEAIAISKQALVAGVVLPVSGYPAVRVRGGGGVETGLVLAIIRQESTFNHRVVSSAGARGLMQMMPNTAARLARKLRLKGRPTEARLSEDDDYNLLLGTAEIQELIRSYRESYLLAIAAYNAGSGHVDAWLRKIGDPRTARVDPIDWIESIPFAETRNYVQRVLEALQVYRARSSSVPRTLAIDLGQR
ncbi:MAG: lytic transglycosylase domain-containing protein [Rhodospirillaceae bacterium]